MRKFLFIAAALLVPALVKAQVYNFAGCDGARSCHQLVFNVTVESQTLYRVNVFGSGFAIDGGKWSYADCSPGCAWNVLPNPGNGWMDDVRHPGISNCVYDAYCSSANWQVMFFMPALQFPNWAPTAASVRLNYDGGPQLQTLNLTAVPEPSTYALMAVGLLGIGLSARRRRQSR